MYKKLIVNTINIFSFYHDRVKAGDVNTIHIKVTWKLEHSFVNFKLPNNVYCVSVTIHGQITPSHRTEKV